MSQSDTASARTWLLPFCVLAGVCLTVFVLTSLIDGVNTGDTMGLLQLAYHPHPEAAANTLANAGEIVAAVLAIALTVVAIIVELASNRYTPRVTELFISEPINFIVMGLFVVTALQGMWVTMTFKDVEDAVIPYAGIGVTMALLTTCLLILLPYLSYVFTYLNPIHIVQRISSHTYDAIRDRRDDDITATQREAIRGVEQLADIALNALERRDKGVSVAGVNAMSKLVTDYHTISDAMPSTWFKIDGDIKDNPDFISMDPHTIKQIERQQIWLETKELRQYQTIYGEALTKTRDLNYVIAINTREMAAEAADDGNFHLLHMCMQFYNSFLRAAINAGDVRTTYNVLNHYRRLAEQLLKYRDGAYTVLIAKYFKYYGLLSYKRKQTFILETVAYDLCSLTEYVIDRNAQVVDALLDIFLKVDRETDDETEEMHLRGVRKAQVKIATRFLVLGDEARARRVYKDMANESPGVLASIRDELFSVTSQEYWEITDRGSNFEYLGDKRHKQLATFFSWFDGLPEKGTMLVEQQPMAPGAAFELFDR